MGNVAEGLHVSKDGQHRPGAEFDHSRDPARQNARQVFGDTSTSDVRHGGNALSRKQLLDNRPIAAVGVHQFVADLALDLVDISLGLVLGDIEEQLTGE